MIDCFVRASSLMMFAFALVIAQPGMAAGDAVQRSAPILSKEFQPVTDAQAALIAVPFAPGASAVVLFNEAQVERAAIITGRDLHANPGSRPAMVGIVSSGPIYGEGSQFIQHRRIKILTEAGIAQHAEHDMTLPTEWQVHDVIARTVQPDGSVVDGLPGIVRGGSREKGYQSIRVRFPEVRVGSILDMIMVVTIEETSLAPWTIQETMPVLLSRFVAAGPESLDPIAGLLGMPPGSVKPTSASLGDLTAHVYEFADVPPLADLPNLPPAADIAKALLVIYNGVGGVRLWVENVVERRQGWDKWMSADHAAAAMLAEQVTRGAASQVEKAEAIRRALRDRVSLTEHRAWPYENSPDGVLTARKGTSADIAGLSVAMLRAVRVPARLALTRRRSSGALPPDIPAPMLFDDLLVMLGDISYSPADDIPVGESSWETGGVLAMPLADDVRNLVRTREPSAENNKSRNVLNARLDKDGLLHVEGSLSVGRLDAQSWRERLRGLAADARRDDLQGMLRQREPGAVLDALEFEGLGDGSQDLVITLAWHVPGFATFKDGHLEMGAFLFDLFNRHDWVADARDQPIELGPPCDRTETVMLRLPEGTTTVLLPAARTLDAAPVGTYDTSFKAKGSSVMCRRHFRRDAHAFPPESWGTLRRWFTDMATNDELPMTISLR